MKNQKEVWNQIAKSWNECRKVASPSVYNFLKEKKGNILDFGCGSGRNFIKIKDQTIYGVDFSEEMIEHAKLNAIKKKIKPILSVQKGDKLNFEDNFFDSVVCSAVLHCIKGKNKRTKLINEIYRVLKPEKEAFFSVWSKKSKRLLNKKKEDYVSWTKGLDEKVLRYNYIYEIGELGDEIKKSGFKINKIWEERNINCIATKSYQNEEYLKSSNPL